MADGDGRWRMADGERMGFRNWRVDVRIQILNSTLDPQTSNPELRLCHLPSAISATALPSAISAAAICYTFPNPLRHASARGCPHSCRSLRRAAVRAGEAVASFPPDRGQ